MITHWNLSIICNRCWIRLSEAVCRRYNAYCVLLWKSAMQWLCGTGCVPFFCLGGDRELVFLARSLVTGWQDSEPSCAGGMHLRFLSVPFPPTVLPASHFVPPTLSLLPSPSGSPVVELTGWSLSELFSAHHRRFSWCWSLISLLCMLPVYGHAVLSSEIHPAIREPPLLCTRTSHMVDWRNSSETIVILVGGMMQWSSLSPHSSRVLEMIPGWVQAQCQLGRTPGSMDGSNDLSSSQSEAESPLCIIQMFKCAWCVWTRCQGRWQGWLWRVAEPRRAMTLLVCFHLTCVLQSGASKGARRRNKNARNN